MHEIARDSFLSNIARLTGENVELRNMLDERGAVDNAVISELEACRAEASRKCCYRGGVSLGAGVMACGKRGMVKGRGMIDVVGGTNNLDNDDDD